jgi:hypothetical protein
VKRKVKRVAKRRAPMAKKKSSWDKTENEDQSDEFETEEGSEQTTDQHNEGEADQAGSQTSEVPVQTETAASEGGVYKLDSVEVAIKGTVYKRGDKVTLTPEELEQVQASGVRILPAE